VTALDVLEHTDDDLLSLREMGRVIKPAGLLLITVPAYGFLWSEHDEALKHRRRYTAHELRNKLTVSGFEVVRTSYFITTLFFPILALRIWQGLRKRSTRPKTALEILASCRSKEDSTGKSTCRLESRLSRWRGLHINDRPATALEDRRVFRGLADH
jgi:hypothetical protein